MVGLFGRLGSFYIFFKNLFIFSLLGGNIAQKYSSLRLGILYPLKRGGGISLKNSTRRVRGLFARLVRVGFGRIVSRELPLRVWQPWIMGWGGGKEQRPATWFLYAVCGTLRGQARTSLAMIPVQQKLRGGCNARIFPQFARFAPAFTDAASTPCGFVTEKACGSAPLRPLPRRLCGILEHLPRRSGNRGGLYSRSLSVFRRYLPSHPH